MEYTTVKTTEIVKDGFILSPSHYIKKHENIRKKIRTALEKIFKGNPQLPEAFGKEAEDELFEYIIDNNYTEADITKRFVEQAIEWLYMCKVQ